MRTIKRFLYAILVYSPIFVSGRSALAASHAHLNCVDIFESIPRARKILATTLIVPAYRELNNGNLQTLMNSLAEQAQGSSDRTILVIVNNTTEIASDLASPVRAENIETVHWLNHARENKLYPFNIEVIDLASRGTERNMGKIRQIGVRQILNERRVPLENHLLVHMDMDSRWDHETLLKLEQSYELPGAPDAVFLKRRYELRGAPSTALLMSHPSYARERLWRDFKILLSNLENGFATYQITSSAAAMDKVGGFHPLERGEDTKLSQDLLNVPHVLSADLTVITEDRARPDGFTAAKRAGDLSGEPGSQRKRLFPIDLLLRPTVLQIQLAVDRTLLSKAEGLKELLSLRNSMFKQAEFGQNADPSVGSFEHQANQILYANTDSPGASVYRAISRRLSAAERDRLKLKLSALKTRAESLHADRRRHLNAVLSNHGAIVPPGDPFKTFIQLTNPEFQQMLETFRKSQAPGLLEDKLVAQFKEWLGEINFGSLALDSLQLQAAYELLVEARANPDSMPSTARLLKEISR